MLKDGRWARDWECCQSCGTIDRPHKGKGLCRKCYHREWCKGNLAHETQRRQWCKRNPNYWYRYRRKNRAAIAAQKREYYQEHREEIATRNRQYGQKHPKKIQELKRRRRIRKRKARIGPVDGQKLYTLYNNTCIYCGGKNDLTLDHIVPLIKGGVHCEDNLVVACRSCNSSKQDQSLEDWLQTQHKSRAWVM